MYYCSVTLYNYLQTKAEQELLEAEEELENASNISNGTELEKLHLKIANCEKEIEAALDEILEYDSACGEEETDNESFTDEVGSIIIINIIFLHLFVHLCRLLAQSCIN